MIILNYVPAMNLLFLLSSQKRTLLIGGFCESQIKAFPQQSKKQKFYFPNQRELLFDFD
ncbi:hypothetical protein TERTU_4020 [Teredinibacter turnerae T7901]|uniref:Uncharacterized protein n=1 Tax=Teredinibacter turnerae (strain ATCC 39867 / T7901) TaxID=377629 RepID=C5BTU5_TERTT|nr:hypothetical protein TERTU_4020 [Teredinibacter turnerae T7901]